MVMVMVMAEGVAEAQPLVTEIAAELMRHLMNESWTASTRR
jgi:hypothetical protein